MASFGGFGAFSQPANTQQNTGFGGFGGNTNNAGGFSAGNSGGFGAANNNNANTGGGLFGGNTGAGGFGNAAFAAPAASSNANNAGGFGSKPAFGAANTTPGGGLFGAANNTANTATGFGGFSTTNAAGGNTFPDNQGLFGNKPTTTFGGGGGGSLFGNTNTNTANTGGFGAGTGGAFGGALNNPGIGSNVGDPPGTSVVPFQAFTEKEVSGSTMNAFQNVAFQDAYKKWSQEELRLADYAQGRRHGNASGAGAFGVGSGFGSGGFGTNTTVTQPSGFGTTANTLGGGMFGTTNSNTSGGFGQTPQAAQTTITTGFGPTAGSSLFGNKPAATGFGTSNTNLQQNTGGGLFGGGGFGANTSNAANTGGFGGAAGTGGLFGNANNQTRTTGFGGLGNTTTTTTASPFGASNTTNNAFGTNNANQNTTSGGASLFGGNSNNTLQAAAGGLFGNTQQNPTSGFGSGGGAFGAQNTQQPATGSTLFGNTAQKPTGGLFGNATSGTAGGLFGNANTTNTAGFGANNSNTTPAGGLFGGAPKPTTTGASLFGGNSNTAQTTGAGTGAGGLFGNMLGGNTQGQQQAPAAGGGLFSSALGPTQKPSLFGASTQAAGTGLFGGAAQQPQNSLFGSVNNQQQPSTLGGSLLGTSQATQSAAPQGLTTSLTDLSAYSSSLFASMGGSVVSSPGPVATPLSKSTARRSSVLPMYKLNPASASRMVTPQKRGFGLSLYGTPTSSTTSATATTPSSLSRSLLGSGVGRGLAKSVSANTLRRTLTAEDSILAPGAFSASTASRLYGGAAGSGKKLVINHDMRSDLFTSPSKDRAFDGSASRKLAKRVSFETDGDSSQPIALLENGSVSPEATPVRGPGDASAVVTPESAEHSRGKELAVVYEEEGTAPATSKTSVVDPSLEVGPWELSPSWDELSRMTPTQRAAVPNFRISRKNAASITFKNPVDLTGLTLEDLCGKIIKLKPREASVYPAGTKKPPRGHGLNVPAQLVIYQAWPRHPDNRGLDDASVKEHVRKLSRVANTKFESYDKNMGIWTFSVPHFTTYGVDSGSDATDDEGGDDDDDDMIVEVQVGSFTSSAPHHDTTLTTAAPAGSFVPGAFDAAAGAIQREQAFLGHSSAGSLSNNEMRLLDDHDPSPLDDEYDMSENDDATVRHSFWQSCAAEQDDFSSDGGQGKAPTTTTTPGGILRARMRALREAAGPVELRVADGDDWMEMLRKSIGPIKADRQALRARQELFESQAASIQPASPLARSVGHSFVDRLHEVASPAKVASRRKEAVTAGLGAVPVLGDNRGFSNNIDLMRSLFDDARTTSPARIAASAHATSPTKGFIKWPCARGDKSDGRGDHADAEVETPAREAIKPSWGPQGIIVYSQSLSSPWSAMSAPPARHRGALSDYKTLATTSHQEVRLTRLSGDVKTPAELLRRHLRFSTITASNFSYVLNGERRTEPVPAVQLLPTAFQEMAQATDASSPSAVHEKLVWELASILFYSLGDVHNDPTRKVRLSQFWKSLVHRSSTTAANLATSSEEKALACLSGHMIPEACKHLVDGRDFHLATLVSLIGASEQSKKDVREQMAIWRQSRVLSEFSHPIRALYELLSGNASRCEGLQNVPKEDRVEAFNISERFGLDWKRSFGLRLWYATGKEDDLSVAVAGFKADIASGHEGLPPPWYREQGIQPLWDDSGADTRQDLLWGLLQLYSDSRVDVESVLRPENSQLSPLDNRLTWQLGVALASVGKAGPGGRGADMMDPSTLFFASQLVSEGDWVSAVFVLLHLSDPVGRLRAVQDLLARQAGNIGPETGETFKVLTADLKIPAAWIWEAQALFMRSVRGDYRAEVRCLVQAGAFVEAHRVLADRVAPQAIVEQDYMALSRLISRFHGHEASIVDWSSGGEIYDTFLQFAEHHMRGRPAPVPILNRLLTSLPAMETRLGSGKGRDYVKHAAVACMADAVARSVLQRAQGLEATGTDIRAKIQSLPLTSDRRLHYSMDQSWDCFRTQVLL